MNTNNELLKMDREFWIEHGLDGIIPKGKEWPEGWDVLAKLRELFDGQRVLDYGCGRGRLTGAFEPENYVGADISPVVLDRAREVYPEHRFEELPIKGCFDAVLVYTVLLHVPDSEIHAVAREISALAPRVVIAEIIGRAHRNEVVHNREISDYIEIFKPVNSSYTRHEYEHYVNTIPGRPFVIMDFRFE